MPSVPLYNSHGLRTWHEADLNARDRIVDTIQEYVKVTLTAMNPAWKFYRTEGPTLVPRSAVSPEYTENEIFITQHVTGIEGARGLEPLVLRAETTETSYRYARHLIEGLGAKKMRPPFCVWQLGKSYRRETSDGASASRLRYNEFHQLEFQCIYSVGTMADYRAAVGGAMLRVFANITGKEVRAVPSDRVPSYAESTNDIEVYDAERDRWIEVCSMSIRTDFADDMRVFELAVGLDRLVELRAI